MRGKFATIILLSFPILALFFFAKFTKCQQSVDEGNNRVKIMAECGNEQMTLHVQFKEDTLPNGRFTDWIIVGTNTRPECRLKGNGELRYIVQIAVLKDPCATKLMGPGVFQNTLRIASFPGLILSDDLNFEFKCAHGAAEILELRLPQSKRTEAENNGQGKVPMRPPPPVSSTPSNSWDRVSPILLTGGDELGPNLVPSSSSIVQQQLPSETNSVAQKTQKSKFMVNSEVGGEGMTTRNAWTEQKGGTKGTAGEEAEEKQRDKSGKIGTGDKQQQARGQHLQRGRKEEADLVVNSNNFDMSDQWEQRRVNSSFPSNLVVVLCGFLALFLVGCVFLAMFHTIKQFRATRRAAPFAHLDSRTSPGNASLSPAESDGNRGRVGVGWGTNMANCDTTTVATNGQRDQLQLGAMEGSSYHTEELNLEPPSVTIPTVPLHSSTKIYGKGGEMRQPNSTKAFGNEHLEEVPKLRNWQGEGKRGHAGEEEEHRRGEFNAAACRSITEIYRRAEMKLKSMMTEAAPSAEGKATEGGTAAGEYSTLKKLDPLKERENLLLNCVNKIRGYGSRKLTEQEMLRWRQLIRSDAQFQHRVFESVSEEQLMRICESPQYRVLFTKTKWAQIMRCIAEELWDAENGGRRRNGSTDTVRRMKPLPALPGPSKFSSNALSQPHNLFNYPNGSLKIFVGNEKNETGER